MRLLWVAAMTAFGVAVACGGSISDDPSTRQPGGGKGGSAGVGGSSGGEPGTGGAPAATGGSAGKRGTGRGGKAGSGSVNSVAGESGSAGRIDAGGSAGSVVPAAGQGGEQLGTGGVDTGGESSGGREPAGCDCEPTEECLKGGGCAPIPACDCAALGVECSPLSSAMGEDFACPVEVQCGSCEAGELCVAPEEPEKFGLRACLAPTASFCTQMPPADPSPCPVEGWSIDCSVVYTACAPLVLPATGALCPTPGGTGVFCGPELL